MNEVWFYAILSVLAVSLISLIGVLTLSIKINKLKIMLIYLVSFSAGALFGDSFLHLLPELVEETGFSLTISFSLLSGIVIFFILEKIIHWQHCHVIGGKEHAHPFAYTNLVGDGLHNFIDGIIIGVSYLVSIPVGIATTLAVILHEIPQEIGDFGVLLHAGFSKAKALTMNFLSALAAVLGTILALWLGETTSEIVNVLVPVAVGGFIYIAGSDLIPELHKHNGTKNVILQILAFVLGIAVMASLLLLE